NVARRLFSHARLALTFGIQAIEGPYAGTEVEGLDRFEPAAQFILVETEVRPVRYRYPVGRHDLERSLAQRRALAAERGNEAQKGGLRRHRQLGMRIEHDGEERGARTRASHNDRKWLRRRGGQRLRNAERGRALVYGQRH